MHTTWLCRMFSYCTTCRKWSKMQLPVCFTLGLSKWFCKNIKQLWIHLFLAIATFWIWDLIFNSCIIKEKELEGPPKQAFFTSIFRFDPPAQMMNDIHVLEVHIHVDQQKGWSNFSSMREHNFFKDYRGTLVLHFIQS